jgi:hypothetical protein
LSIVATIKDESMIGIVKADLNVPAYADAVVRLMNEYALDPMGGGEGLSDYAKANLAAELTKRKTAHVVLALVDAEPAGLLVCFEGFSTFACRPLLNIHDVIVALPHRGKGFVQTAATESGRHCDRVGLL